MQLDIYVYFFPSLEKVDVTDQIFLTILDTSLAALLLSDKPSVILIKHIQISQWSRQVHVVCKGHQGALFSSPNSYRLLVPSFSLQELLSLLSY